MGRGPRSGIDKADLFLFGFMAVVLIPVAAVLIAFSIVALASADFAVQLKGESSRLIAAVLIIGGVVLGVQTIKGHRRHYVWRSVSTQFGRDEGPRLSILVLTSHYLMCVAMLLFGIALLR